MKKLLLIVTCVLIYSCEHQHKRHVSKQERAQKAITQYVVAHLNDPKSYESVAFSKLSKDSDSTEFGIRHIYRAKNVFGGIITTSECFSIDSSFKDVECCFRNCPLD